MHLLVLPTEEYCPSHEPMAGIFQRHQIEALRSTGSERIGVVSVRMRHSVPMYLKTALFRTMGRKLDNALAPHPSNRLLPEMARRWRAPEATVVQDAMDGVPVTRIEGIYGTPPDPRLDPIWWLRTGWRAVLAYMDRNGRPDLIHAHNAVAAGLLAARLRRRFGIPYVLSEHSSAYHQNTVPRVWYPALRRVFRGADTVMPVSAALWSTIEDRLGPLGVTPEVTGNVLPPYFAQTPPAPRPERTGAVCLCVASLLEIKNHANLLEGFALLRRKRPDATLRLLGDGPQRPLLEARAAAPDLDGSVRFLGGGGQARVRVEMDAADLLVLPSHFETFGVVLIEAMARGRPVVAMRSGGPAEVVSDATGRLVMPGDPAALAKGLAETLDDPQLRRPDALRAYVEARWGGEAFCRRLRRLYAGGRPPETASEGACHGAPA